MMTPNQEQKLLDRKASTIQKQAQSALDQVMARIRKGDAPRDALSQVTKTFKGAYVKELSQALSEILQASVGEKSVLGMVVGNVSLSARMYRETQTINSTVLHLINSHSRGFDQARGLTLKIFEGYGFKSQEVLNLHPGNKALPKYLRDELLVDPGLKGELALHFARAQALRLKTPALRASYLEYMDAIEDGAGLDLLEKKLRTAYYERMRYFANRIAQTELHRAYADMQAREVMADEDVQFVQYRMSRTHPKTDICDLFAKRDLYGLGPGVYPKSQCPKAPQHPYCRCVCAPRLDIPVDAKARLHPGASQDYLRSLDEREAARVMGSKARLQAVLQGKDPLAVWNTNTDPMYRVRLVGDVAKAAGLGVDGGMSDAYNIAKNGGKHSGFLKLWEGKDKKSIQKSLDSLQGQIDVHLDKIANPDKYFTEAVSQQRRECLTKRHWPKEIRTFQAQHDILNALLKEKGYDEK